MRDNTANWRCGDNAASGVGVGVGSGVGDGGDRGERMHDDEPDDDEPATEDLGKDSTLDADDFPLDTTRH